MLYINIVLQQLYLKINLISQIYWSYLKRSAMFKPAQPQNDFKFLISVCPNWDF